MNVARLLFLLCWVVSSAAQGGDRLIIATATPGGSFSAFGEALAKALRTADPGLEIILQPTKGSGENVPLLAAGKVDMATVEGTVLHETLHGIGRAPLMLPLVSAMFPSPGMFVVRGDSAYGTVEDLRGKRVVFGVSSSGFVVLARYVLDGLGWDMRKDFDAVLLDQAKDGPPLILKGEAQALWGGGLGWPAFQAVAQGPRGARFIGLSATQIATVRAKHPFLKPLTVQPGAYTGLSEALNTVGTWSWLAARPDLPEHLAYRFSRALWRARQTLAELFPAAQSTPADSLAALPPGAALHSGVVKHFDELGVK